MYTNPRFPPGRRTIWNGILPHLEPEPICTDNLERVMKNITNPRVLETECDLLNEQTKYPFTSINGEVQSNHFRNFSQSCLPYDRNRVLLKTYPSNPMGYINASWATHPQGQNGFILTQNPLKETISDFWRMIWENKYIRVIIMCEDQFRPGEFPYFFEYYQKSQVCDSFKVRCMDQKADDEGLFVRRIINLQEGTDMENSRNIFHFQFLKWPNVHSNMSRTDELLGFINHLRSYYDPSLNSVVVHCQDGVTKCGLFYSVFYLTLLIDMALKYNNLPGASISIFKTVKAIRKYRMGIISKKEQYFYLYRCASHYMQWTEEMNSRKKPPKIFS